MKLTPKAKMILLMARCEYIELNAPLTRKGRGLLPAWAWRKWNDILGALSAKHQKEVVEFLRDTHQRQMVRDLTREGRTAELC